VPRRLDAISYILANADDLLRMKKEPRPKLEKGKEGKTFKSKETIDTDDEGDSDWWYRRIYMGGTEMEARLTAISCLESLIGEAAKTGSLYKGRER
jgi:hypothetical protein